MGEPCVPAGVPGIGATRRLSPPPATGDPAASKSTTTAFSLAKPSSCARLLERAAVLTALIPLPEPLYPGTHGGCRYDDETLIQPRRIKLCSEGKKRGINKMRRVDVEEQWRIRREREFFLRGRGSWCAIRTLPQIPISDSDSLSPWPLGWINFFKRFQSRAILSNGRRRTEYRAEEVGV